MNHINSRDLVWKLLIENKIDRLPIDLENICRTSGIQLFTYKSLNGAIEKLKLEENIISNDAFSIGTIIFYDDTTSIQRQRFSIAHEMGHIFLHSTEAKLPTVYNREPSANDNPQETEANQFAARLLAPLVVLQFLTLILQRKLQNTAT